MSSRTICALLLFLGACAATPESETKRWQNNLQDAGSLQSKFPGVSSAVAKLQMDATAKYNESQSKSGNAQLQDMQQANKILDQLLNPYRDYDREVKEAEFLIPQVPTAAPILQASVSNTRMALGALNTMEPNIVIGAFRGAYDQVRPVVDWANQIKSGNKNAPMPTVPGMTGMPGMGIPVAAPGVAPGAGMPGGAPGAAPGADPMGVPGGIPSGIPGGIPSGVPGGIPTGVPSNGPGENPGSPTEVPPAIAPTGGPGGN
jgi:hypothetical protein